MKQYAEFPKPLCALHTGRSKPPRCCETCLRLDVEREIAYRIGVAALTAGLRISLDDDSTEFTDIESYMANVSETDMVDIHLIRDGKVHGAVRLVYGNSGWDAITEVEDNDFSTDIEELLEPIEDWIAAELEP